LRKRLKRYKNPVNYKRKIDPMRISMLPIRISVLFLFLSLLLSVASLASASPVDEEAGDIGYGWTPSVSSPLKARSGKTEVVFYDYRSFYIHRLPLSQGFYMDNSPLQSRYFSSRLERVPEKKDVEFTFFEEEAAPYFEYVKQSHFTRLSAWSGKSLEAIAQECSSFKAATLVGLANLANFLMIPQVLAVIGRQLYALQLSGAISRDFLIDRLPSDICENWVRSTPGFVGIPAGEFMMGSPAGEAGCSSDEAAHLVKISRPFELKARLVTEGEWQQLMGSNPSDGFANRSPDERVGDCPVQQISWFDAVVFCIRLAEKEGLKPYYVLSNETGTPGVAGYSFSSYTVNTDGLTSYRLPTEAEWEWAARGGSLAARYADDVSEIAWLSFNSGDRTHPVGLKRANGYGLYDMLGNVYEWVEDWYGAYLIDTTGAAQIDPRGPKPGGNRVFRGGSYRGDPDYVRAALRYFGDPSGRGSALGFRVARSFH
jgi:formylglycine-generating enzyme required for sulfatase activity